MLKLVIKDFRISKFYLLLLFIVLAAVSVGFMLSLRAGNSIEAELYVIVVILSAVISSKLFLLIEAEADADRLFIGLPITRKQLVVSKYIVSTLMILLVLMVHLVAVLASSSVEMRNENYLMFYPAMWIISGLVLILSDSLSFPFYFRFGLLKGGIMYGITMLTLSLLTVFTLGQINRSIWFHDLVMCILSQPIGFLITEFIALFILILWGSIFISISVFKNKDL